MALDVLKLKKAAVALGMDKDEARKANRATLEAFLSEPAKPARKAPVKKGTPPVKKATRTTTAKAPARKVTRKATPVKRTTKPAAKKPVPAKAPAVRKTAKRPANKNGNGDAGRNLLGSLDFTNTDGWNPRAGSAVDVIFRALKRTRGDVDKAFAILVPNIADFVGPKKQDGSKRSKADRENMLRYRISRTKFDFAIKTGQHEIATARVEYGTGQYATTRAKKPVRKAATPKPKPTTKRVASKPPVRRAATKRTPARKTARKR